MRVGDRIVIACAAHEGIGARAADQQVIARAAVQRVVTSPWRTASRRLRGRLIFSLISVPKSLSFPDTSFNYGVRVLGSSVDTIGAHNIRACTVGSGGSISVTVSV